MTGLLSISSFVDDAGVVWIRFASGEMRRVEDPQTAQLIAGVVGEEVTLVEEAATSHFDEAPLHLLTFSSLEWLAARRPADQVDPRRFRPNLVIDSQGQDRMEDAWLGRNLRIRDVTVTIEQRTERCVMTTMAQAGLSFVPTILSELHAQSDSRLGVYGRVTHEGFIRVGDEVTLVQ